MMRLMSAGLVKWPTRQSVSTLLGLCAVTTLAPHDLSIGLQACRGSPFIGRLFYSAIARPSKSFSADAPQRLSQHEEGGFCRRPAAASAEVYKCGRPPRLHPKGLCHRHIRCCAGRTTGGCHILQPWSTHHERQAASTRRHPCCLSSSQQQPPIPERPNNPGPSRLGDKAVRSRGQRLQATSAFLQDGAQDGAQSRGRMGQSATWMTWRRGT